MGMENTRDGEKLTLQIFSYRTQLRIQPLLEDYGVTTFTPFHNMGCAHSFIYYNEKVCFGLNLNLLQQRNNLPLRS